MDLQEGAPYFEPIMFGVHLKRANRLWRHHGECVKVKSLNFSVTIVKQKNVLRPDHFSLLDPASQNPHRAQLALVRRPSSGFKELLRPNLLLQLNHLPILALTNRRGEYLRLIKIHTCQRQPRCGASLIGHKYEV